MPLGVMAAMAAASEEIFRLFEWNREVYKFDREQRLTREELRMEMQMRRFGLFREDIRDLVELTVGRMDMYHLVGALFIEFCVVLFAEGRVHAVAPPFLLSLYHFTAACSFVYLLLTVWLAMHASIAAQSFGTRLLLRYVRLPIPTNTQIDSLSANLAEYETQGVGNVLRVPFVQRPRWFNTEGTDSAPYGPAGQSAKVPPGVSVVGKKYLAEPASPVSVVPTQGRKEKDPLPDPDNRRMWLGKAEVPFSGEDDFLLATGNLPGQHVELFRRLQAKWSCYDAYARVCMQFGVHHILIALSYFALCVTVVENRSPTCGWAMVMVLQACQMGITALDMSTFARHFLVALHSMSAAPLLAATASVTWAARHPNGAFLENNTYPAAFLAFLFQLAWLELLLYVSSPDSDDGRVPKKSRTVFYMDVFGEAEETNDRQNRSQEEEDDGKSGDMSPKTANAHRRLQMYAESVRSALAVTRASINVWDGMPQEQLTEGQKRELARLAAQLELCHRVIRDQVSWCVDKHLLPNQWADEFAQTNLRFAQAIVGPFEQTSDRGVETWFVDLETNEHLNSVPSGRQVITLAKVLNMIQELKTRARYLREAAIEANGGQAGTLTKGIPRTPEEYRAILPWRVLCYTTRLVQFCLAWLCAVTVLREYKFWRMDYAEQPKGAAEEGEGEEGFTEHEGGEGGSEGSSGHEEVVATTTRRKHRRLSQQPGRLPFRRLEVIWPYGLFFRPEVLSCLPGAVVGGHRLLMSSPFSHYGAAFPWDEAPLTISEVGALPSEGVAAWPPLRLRELPDTQFPPTAVALCAATEASQVLETPSCLMALPTPRGVAIWPADQNRSGDDSVLLPVDGRPWRRLSGAVIKCDRVDSALLPRSSLPPAAGAPEQAEWCLLLAGWDGARLPVALLPLPAGPKAPPAAGQRIRPGLDVPVVAPKRQPEPGRAASADMGLTAMHVEPRRARLWVLLAGGELRLWDLLRPRSLGRWPSNWPSEAGDFQAAALCEDSDQFLYVVGRAGSSGPTLLQADLLEGGDASEAESQPSPRRPLRGAEA